MRARYWMIGCLIGLAGMGSAVASDCSARDIAATSRAPTDNATRDAGNNGGDTLGLNRDGSASLRRGNGADNADANGRSGGVGDGGEHDAGSSTPADGKPAMLGWQSLLPGSIQ